MYLGVDIGSTTSKAVILDKEGNMVGRSVIDSGTGSRGPQQAVEQALQQAGIGMAHIRRCVATGYGRMLYKDADKQVTEISCHAKGVSRTVANARTIIDIGGQDSKVISLDSRGKVENFVMNEKCAAGTGRFLEVMAKVMGCKLEELSDLASSGKEGVSISSVCTVFAESEMISQLSAGKTRADVALGAHKAIAARVSGLARRLDIKPEVVMTGGAALNESLVRAIEEAIGLEIRRLNDPQIMGALGAAAYAMEMDEK